MRRQADIDIDQAGVLAGIGQELNLVKAHRELAIKGHGFLVVRAPGDDEAQKVADVLDGKSFIVVRSAGETGQLYGSVAARDVVEILGAEGFNIGRNQVHLNTPIKSIGLHKVELQLHAEVEIHVELNVARSAEEAERQAKGEELTSVDAIYGVDEDALRPEDFFDPEADGVDEDEA
jgi:large subunit ribosomal protein L9